MADKIDSSSSDVQNFKDKARCSWVKPDFEEASVALDTATNFNVGGSDSMFFS